MLLLSSCIFNSEIINQLNTVFSIMENPLVLKLYLDNRPVSSELKEYMNIVGKNNIDIDIDSLLFSTGRSK